MTYHGRRGRATTLLAVALLWMGATAHAQSLRDLVQEAVDVHPAVRAASAARSAADSDLETARWQYFPTPSVSVEHTGSSTDPTRGDSSIQTFRIEQPLWQGGRLDLGVKRSEVQIRDRSALLAQSRQQIALAVVQAFGEWHAARLKIAAVDDSLSVHSELLAQIERRIGEGLSPRSDRALAITRQEQVHIEMASHAVQRRVALSRLGQLLGREIRPGELERIVTEEAHVASDMGLLVNRALDRDPSVSRAQSQADTASIDADLVAASRWPSVSMYVEQQNGASYQGGSKRIFRAGISLRTAFGAGLSAVSGIDSARARARGAQDDLESARRSVIDQVQSDYLQYNALSLRRMALREAIRSSASVKESYDRQYLAGSKSWMDVMNAVRELAQLTVQSGEIEGGLFVTGWRLAIHADGLDALLSAMPAVPVLAITGDRR